MKTTTLIVIGMEEEPEVSYSHQLHHYHGLATIRIRIGDATLWIDATAKQAERILERLSQPPDKVDSGGRKVS